MFVGTKFGLFMPGLRPTTGKDAKEPNDPRDLQVRSRRKIDLDRLREYLPELGPTLQLRGHDYQFRAYCTREQWGEALKRIALDIDYTKFKDSPKQLKDYPLMSAYLKIWSATLGAFPEGSIYDPRPYSKRYPAVTKTTKVETVEYTRFSDLTPNQRRLLDEQDRDRLWDEREPDVLELMEIEDEHKAYLWRTSEEQRRIDRVDEELITWLDENHMDCTHADSRSARRRCTKKRRKGK